MVTRRHYPAALLVKARDAFAICLAQPVAGINSEEPKLINICRIKNTQDVVVAFSIEFTIARRDFVTSRSEMITEQRESIDIPVVFDIWNRGLQ